MYAIHGNIDIDIIKEANMHKYIIDLLELLYKYKQSFLF
jgi:hypothetical protein